ncbi:probable WRKY transcription factor 2 [Phtheirospermum japonicum]|uniref:Probable WRKY transcription factor 2 n=1 Tax=Phtheirospermum japonicum TaxID=374723 RepID=A0A830CQ00_9LAMI|nr:probable WRKY transcription factor 2 [Phtheirospermum japonicum]
MGGFDDHVVIMGDWMPPSPSPQAFFSSMTNDDTLVRSLPDSVSENKIGRYFEGQSDQDCLTQASSRADEPKMSSRGGLMERRAARAGFNAPRLNTESIRNGDISKEQEVRSPYLTIPPGLSPTTLLDSPVFLTNSLAQPSPTTGKFLFGPSGNNFRNSTLMTNDRDNCNENTFEDATSFAFKPIPESGSVHASGLAPHPFPSFGVSNTTSRQNQITEPPKTAENSPPLDEPHEDDGDQRSGGGQSEDDGYNWRKYGQKQVKGSEYPRSYYKCTHPNCPVKKKVERSYEGHITEIIYKGAHVHPKPPPSRRSSSLGPSNEPGEVFPLESEQTGMGPGGDLVCSGQEYGNGANGSQYESGDVVDGSCTFSNDEEEDRATHGSVSLGYEGEGDELESKRRRIDTYASEISGATRAIREPRVVVQTTSEVDILDDGYRWRKYGQKVVKGNPNPRSYYKCTSPGCNVRKHVERASHDLKSVITTYEGKHNHDVPAARNSSHVGSQTLPAQQAPSAASHMQRPEPSQIHSSGGRFNRHSLGSFGLPGRPQQMGPGPGFGGFGLNQQSLANLGLSGLGHNQGKLPVMQVNPYLGRQIRPVNDMGFVLPKPEPKLEPVMDSGLNSSDGSLVYQQLMSRLPLGP